MSPGNDRRLQFGEFILDLGSGCVHGRSVEVKLRRKTFGVLRHLVLNAGRLVSKDDLIAAVWSSIHVSDASLVQCISEIRTALRDHDQQLVRTIVGRGYRFVATVSDARAGASASDEAGTRHSSAVRTSSIAQIAGVEYAGPTGARPLVGREGELDWMLRRWRDAMDGRGQVVLVSGEAGIGKSRLAAEFRASLVDQAVACLRYVCSHRSSGSVLHPAIGEIVAATAIEPQDSGSDRRAKLHELLQQLSVSEADRTALVLLLSPSSSADSATSDLLPQERRQRMLEALVRRVEAQSRIAPTLAIVEDLHWTDPTSFELFERLAARAAHLPLLLILTFRPDIAAPFIGEHHVSLLTLGRLAPHHCRTLISHLAGDRIVPELVDVILARSEGVPLFIEELTRSAMDANVTLARDIPISLQASLMTRLDRLGTARNIAQSAAAVGRSFSATLLADATGLSASELMPQLDRLTESGLILRQGPRAAGTFMFRHALLRDAAHACIPEDQRQQLNARIAQAMLRQPPGTSESAPELIAHHFAEAGKPQQAFTWWRRAGENAIRQAAFDEAIGHFNKAIAIAERSDAAGARTPVQLTERLALQVAFSQALLWGRNIEESITAFARARELAAGIEDGSVRLAAYYGLWAGNMMNARLVDACAVAEDFLRDTRDAGLTAEAGVAHRTLGTACWFMGRFQKARNELSSALRLYDVERDRGASTRFSVVPGPPALICLALTSSALGEAERARHFADQALSEADRTAHVPTQTYVLTHALILELIGQESGLAPKLAQQLVTLCSDHGLPHIDYARVLDLAVRFRSKGLADAAHRMRGAIDQLCRRGTRLGLPWFMTMLADMEMQAGDIEIAVATTDIALAEIARSEERWYESRIHHLRGRLLFKQGRIAEGRAALMTAARVAHSQQAAGFADLISGTIGSLARPSSDAWETTLSELR